MNDIASQSVAAQLILLAMVFAAVSVSTWLAFDED